jgi:hypothetical protein
MRPTWDSHSCLYSRALPLLLLLLLLARPAHTATAAPWRPAPLRAAPLAVAATPSGGLALSALLTTWDGWFLDEYVLPAGELLDRLGAAVFFFLLLSPSQARVSAHAHGALNPRASPSPSSHYPNNATGTKVLDDTGDQWALSRDVTLTLAPPTPSDVDRIR